jgi:hypothetical protein
LSRFFGSRATRASKPAAVWCVRDFRGRRLELEMTAAQPWRVYYDVEGLTESARHAIHRERRVVNEIALNGLDLEPLGGAVLERLTSSKDLDWLDQLMCQVESLFCWLRRSRSGELLFRNGGSLLDAARYRFLLEIAPWERRRQVAEQMAERGETALLWVTDRVGFSRAAARLLARRRGHTVEVRGTRSAQQLARAAIDALYEASAPLVRRTRIALRKKRSRLAPARVLFCEFFPNSVRALEPVARALSERGISVRWLALRRSVATVLRERGFDVDDLDDNADRTALFAGELTPRESVWLTKAFARQDLADAWPMPTSSEAEKAFRLVLRRCLGRALADAAHWSAMLHGVVSAYEPAVVASTTYSSVPGRAVALAARACGAKSIYVQHGVFPVHSVYADFLHEHLCLWGNQEATGLATLGADARTMHVTGSTLYDDLRSRSRSRNRPFPSTPDRLRVAFLASRTSGAFVSADLGRRTMEAVASLADRFPGLAVTIKAHPGERTQVPEQVCHGRPNVTLLRGGSSQDVVIDHDVAIIVTSTTGFEAVVAERPLVVLRFTDDASPVDFVRHEAALEARSADDLASVMLRLCEQPATHAGLARGRQRVCDDMLAGASGDAATRIADVIEGCL